MSLKVGIDVGGTFTDFLVLGSEPGRIVHKTSSTPQDPSEGVIVGLEDIAKTLGQDLGELIGDLEVIVHGTTVTTNAALTGSGAKTGLLTTEGFRDVLALRDGTREETYNNRMRPPEPLVPRYLRLGVSERVNAAGEVATPLDEAGLRASIETLGREGIEAVAISFMHSPQNSDHERRAAEITRELLPGAYVTASSELLPQVRLYPRTSTTVLNAYVGPIITRYMQSLTGRLEELGFSGVLLIMQSNGGVATPAQVSRRAALTLLSGPAAGPAAALSAIAPHDQRDCLTIDMGGTSFDIALVKGGEPLVMTDGELARWRLALPMIDIHTIGAGGGSIASIDHGGMLHVGPRSAGADPGPACYGQGGELPTVTDADLLLGLLDPDAFLRGAMQLDPDAAARSIRKHVAEPLGLDPLAAAAGIYQLVNVSMAAGVREVTVRRGLDPRDFPLVVAGGAGGVHAAAIAEELEIPLLVIPRESSIFCASGMLVSDFKHDYVRSLKASIGDLDPADVRTLLEQMAEEGLETLAGEGIEEQRVTMTAAADLRYVGQWHEITVPIEWEVGRTVELSALLAAFHAQHDSMFGYSSPDAQVESLALRLSTAGLTEKAPPEDFDDSEGDAEAALSGRRDAWNAAQQELVDTPVFDGSRLGFRAHLAGPALIEMANTTIVVLAGFDMLVDRHGSLVVYSRERGRQLAERLVPEPAAAFTP